MELKQNPFGDYLVYKNGVNKGYSLKLYNMHKVFTRKGVPIGCILKRDDYYISYDLMGNTISQGSFEDMLLGFFKQKKG